MLILAGPGRTAAPGAACLAWLAYLTPKLWSSRWGGKGKLTDKTLQYLMETRHPWQNRGCLRGAP
jgi:hypothetical protein